MKNIVFDSSTLILLVKSDLLKFLLDKQRIYIPQAVFNESTSREDVPDAIHIKHLVDTKQINIKPTKDTKTIKILFKEFRLDPGEAEAITLAKELKSLCGIDDYLGIRACKVLDIPYTTATGFLIEFYRKNKLSKEEALSKIDLLYQFGWYKKAFIERIKHEIQTN